MRINQLTFRILAICVLVQVAFTSPAAAYIDPGSGSFFIQMLLAGLLGLGMAVKAYWHRIKSFFSGSKPTPPSSDETHN